jgi:hypothetical protein
MYLLSLLCPVGAIINWPVKSSVAIETHCIIFVFTGELTNWPDKIVSRNRAGHLCISQISIHGPQIKFYSFKTIVKRPPKVFF